jgi:cellulose synthase/poly-beta-1,6-N-acetylglucosamine synthase-like glycosyltransferase
MVFGTLYFIFLAGSVMAALQVATILLETIAAITLPVRIFSPLSGGKTRDRVGVLIPAHNEEETLSETIANIQPQLRYGDWLLVVADNCSDGTAAIAKGLGADVIVRIDPTNKGKGFALDWGIRHFAADPPEIVVVVDADCKLGNFAIDHLAAMCKAKNRPVQAYYSMAGPPNSTPSTRLREFAYRVNTWIRPLGLSSAGLPCQLVGTGMAFPWEIIAPANLATGALVEDLKLGLELAANGYPPIFCPAATVTSEFPATREGSRSQQLRWEQGHLSVIAAEIPWLILRAIRRGDKDLLAMTLDAAVPPFSLLWMIILLFLGLGLGSWRMGMGSAALLVSLGNLSGFICAILVCWQRVGRDLLTLRSVFFAGLGALGKIPFYYGILFKRNTYTWIRTDRRK